MSEISLIGKKIGMTREFYKTGQSVPVTVVKMEKARVIQVIEQEKRGYKAVQLGFGKIKNSKLSKAMKGFYTKKNTEPKKKLQEFRVEKTENYKEGNEFGLEIFKDIKFVDVKSKTIGKGFAGVMKRYNFSGLRATHGVSVSHRSHGSTGQRQDPGKVFKDIKFVDVKSKTIGKGFAGVMKRHNFSGLRATHGVSVSHRSHGSTGQRQDPGKVFKGKKMAGHMGNKLRTVLNIEIVKSDVENNLLYLKGSIPGSKNAEVLVKKAVKNIQKLTIKEKIEVAEKAKKTPDKKKK